MYITLINVNDKAIVLWGEFILAPMFCAGTGGVTKYAFPRGAWEREHCPPCNYFYLRDVSETSHQKTIALTVRLRTMTGLLGKSASVEITSPAT